MKKKRAYDRNDSFGWLMATAANQLRQRLNKKFSQAGLDITAEQWGVLLPLWKDDGLSQQSLATMYMRSKVAIFKLIGGLEKKGLVTRTPDPDDGRSNQIFLTPRGKALQEPLIDLAKENLSEAARGICEKDLDTFKKVLRQLIINTRN